MPKPKILAHFERLDPCGDEPNFGYDPVGSLVAADAGTDPETDRSSRITWNSRVIRSGDGQTGGSGNVVDGDEFQLFRQLRHTRERRRATLIQVDGEHGILYTPHSQVLSLDPDPASQDPIGHRLPGETLVEGLFVVRPILGQVDLGEVHAEHGHYSQRWKTRLVEERRNDPAGLSTRLREAGLNLVHLDSAIADWCRPPTTVIHAPQQLRHFEILIRVLGVHPEPDAVAHHRSVPWWQRAWNEIRRSRGEAIQAGVQGMEIVEEFLLGILGDMLLEIRLQADTSAEFHIQIPAGHELQGFVLFSKVLSVEEGFLVPETELKVIQELDLVEQWRE